MTLVDDIVDPEFLHEFSSKDERADAARIVVCV